MAEPPRRLPAAHSKRPTHTTHTKPLNTRMSSTKPRPKPLGKKTLKPTAQTPTPAGRTPSSSTPKRPQQQQQRQSPPPTTAAPRNPHRPAPQKTTTIPLPTHPRIAPSPQKPSWNSMPYAKPSLPPSSTSSSPSPSSSPQNNSAPQPQPQQPPPPPGYRPSTSTRRIIEPTPDIRLPAKYKPAARRVTSIIVGIPIILVFGYELYSRYRREIGRKWEEGGERRV